MEITKKALIQLRPEIGEALAELGRKHGITFKVGNGAYTADGATGHFKLEMEVADPAVKEAADRARFAEFASAFGLKDEDFGARFMNGGRTFRITGIDLKRRARPITAHCEDDGRGYVFDEKSVARLLMFSRVAA